MSGRATARLGRLLLALPVAALLAGIAACVDEETVFVEKPPFDQPSDTMNKFLGYVSPVENQLPACGNCHATEYGSWKTTGHRDAWEDLQASGGAQEFCNACHTISEAGNPLEGAVGHDLVADDRYLDVQCESCHGPGWDHVNGPTAENAPLCSIEADTAADLGCGECHNGTHHPFVEQWAQTAHANRDNHASAEEGCDECHEGRKALERKFYETSEYVEKLGTEIVPITCAVCHDPHGSEFEGDLRGPVDIVPSEEPSTDHLCYRCHSRRGTLPSSRGGVHAAQGFLVTQQSIGWIPAGFTAPILGSHGDPTANPKVCVGCHVIEYEVLDEANELVLNSVGHLFEALPCTDTLTGVPYVGDCDDADRDFTSCLTCHGAGVEALYQSLRDDINALLDSLWVDVDADARMDVDGTDTGLLPLVAARAVGNPADTLDIYFRDQLITVGEGAVFNAQIAYTDDRPYWGSFRLYPGITSGGSGTSISTHKASGNGVHNPAWLRAILQASINAVLNEYFSDG